MAEFYEIEASLRDGKRGSRAAQALRHSGRIPAVVYGAGFSPLAITIARKEATLRLHAGGFMNTVLALRLDGELLRVLPKAYQLHPVRDTLLHLDFIRVTRGSVITVDVPVYFENEELSPGLKRGGVLNVVRHSVELQVPADRIPDHLVVDLTGAELGDVIHISNVKLPEGVVPTISDRDFTIATVATPAGLKGEVAAEGAQEESTKD